MNDSDKIKIYLSIGGQRVSLTVPFNRQEFAREVEAGVDRLYSRWRKAFPAKTDNEILAMVAYQYASFYGELKERYEKATAKASECLSRLEDEPSAGNDPDEEPF